MTPAGPRFSGRVVLVTGAASGIGRATVLALARQGAAVAVSYSKPEAVTRETAKLAEQAGGRALPVRAQVTRDREARAMVDEVVRELGGLDGLVNNAGLDPACPAPAARGPHRRDLGAHPRHQPARPVRLRAGGGAASRAARRGCHRQHHRPGIA
jgi:NAD(P)-dependent dehydrogenase (short-subunit alcohol dehydrogenase family)